MSVADGDDLERILTHVVNWAGVDAYAGLADHKLAEYMLHAPALQELGELIQQVTLDAFESTVDLIQDSPVELPGAILALQRIARLREIFYLDELEP